MGLEIAVSLWADRSLRQRRQGFVWGLKAKKAPEEGARESPEPREPGEPVRRGVAVVRRD